MKVLGSLISSPFYKQIPLKDNYEQILFYTQ